MENRECVEISDLAVRGQDLIQLGMKPGKEMGKLLHELLEYVIEHPMENEKEKLIRHFSGEIMEKKSEKKITEKNDIIKKRY